MVTKNGWKNGKQRYRCHVWGRYFSGGEKPNPANLRSEYVIDKQTYARLALKYECSIKTIQRKIDSHKVNLPSPQISPVIVLMDTTYWGRNFGLMLFKGATCGRNLLKKYVQYETNAIYVQGIDELKGQGYLI